MLNKAAITAATAAMLFAVSLAADAGTDGGFRDRSPILARGYGYRRTLDRRDFGGRHRHDYSRPYYRRGYWLPFVHNCWQWRFTPWGMRKLWVCIYPHPGSGWGYVVWPARVIH